MDLFGLTEIASPFHPEGDGHSRRPLKETWNRPPGKITEIWHLLKQMTWNVYINIHRIAILIDHDTAIFHVSSPNSHISFFNFINCIRSVIIFMCDIYMQVYRFVMCFVLFYVLWSPTSCLCIQGLQPGYLSPATAPHYKSPLQHHP